MSLGSRALRLAAGAHVLAVAVIGALAYLGQLPPGPLAMHEGDKVMHFVLIGGVAFWIVGGWGDRRLEIGGVRLPWAVVLPLALAAVEEAAQALSPRRNPDLWDLAADALGLVVFWWLGAALASRRRRARVARRELVAAADDAEGASAQKAKTPPRDYLERG